MSQCEGSGGLACIDGWLYSGIGMMIFSTNRRCPKCQVDLSLDVYKALLKDERNRAEAAEARVLELESAQLVAEAASQLMVEIEAEGDGYFEAEDALKAALKPWRMLRAAANGEGSR